MANPYTRGSRPSRVESLPAYLDHEFLSIQRAFGNLPSAAIGGGGVSSDSLIITAGEALGGDRAVYVAADGKAYYADQSNATARLVCGVTTGAAASGAAVTVRIQSTLVEPTWAWTVSDIVWLSTTGLLTQTVPTSGYLVQVGVPVGPTQLRIEPQFIAKI